MGAQRPLDIFRTLAPYVLTNTPYIDLARVPGQAGGKESRDANVILVDGRSRVFLVADFTSRI